MEILNKHFKNKDDQNDFYIALVVITFFSFGILGALFFTNTTEKLFTQKIDNLEVSSEQETVSTEIETPPVLDNLKEEVALKQNQPTIDQEEQISNWVDSLKVENIQNTAIVPSTVVEKTTQETKPILEINEYAEVDKNVSQEEIVSAAEKASMDTTSIQNEVAKIENSATNTLGDFKESIVTPKESIDTDGKTTSTDRQEEVTKIEEENVPEKETASNLFNNDFSDKKCIIMIGAFSDGQNAAQVIDRLQADEYIVFASYRKGYRTIGVRSSCEQTTLNATLTKIRKNYAKDAFVIK